MRRQGWAVAVSVVVIGVLFVAVFPTRTWLAQRRELDATEQRVSVLAAQNASLEARVSRLNTDAEIERLAREQYNLVLPGEEAFAILPAPPPARPAPAPEPAAAEEQAGFWAQLWDDLSFW